MVRSKGTIAFGKTTDGKPIAIVNDEAADALTAEAEGNEEAASDAVAAMHEDPELDPFADDATEKETEMSTVNVMDYALSPEDAAKHVETMKTASADEIRTLNARRRGVTPVDARLGPDPHASKRAVIVDAHSPGGMAPKPTTNVNGFADKAEASMRDRMAKRAQRDAELKEQAEQEAANMTADRKANPDKQAAASTAKPKATTPKAEPKAKTGTCIFSGLPTGGGSFRPGYDAKLKGALIKAQRGQTPDFSLASDEMRERFESGDLSTDEGRLAFAATRDWEKYLTPVTKTTAERTAKKVAKASPDAVMDDLVDAIMRLDWPESRKLAFAAELDDAFQRHIKEQDEEDALDEALAEPTPTGQPETPLSEVLADVIDPASNELNGPTIRLDLTQGEMIHVDLTEEDAS